MLDISVMDPAHACNVKNWLLKHAQAIVTMEARSALITVSMHDGGERAHDTLENITNQLLTAAKTHKQSVDYLKKMPCFRAIKKRSRKDRTIRRVLIRTSADELLVLL